MRDGKDQSKLDSLQQQSISVNLGTIHVRSSTDEVIFFYVFSVQKQCFVNYYFEFLYRFFVEEMHYPGKSSDSIFFLSTHFIWLLKKNIGKDKISLYLFREIFYIISISLSFSYHLSSEKCFLYIVEIVLKSYM